VNLADFTQPVPTKIHPIEKKGNTFRSSHLACNPAFVNNAKALSVLMKNHYFSFLPLGIYKFLGYV
jgi:hypothetical protein